jgi:flavin reductase (DIM6/NTAB) family NADH-FMN oxidoreductase RutF
MRQIVTLILLVLGTVQAIGQCTPPAPPVISAGQTRFIVSDANVNDDVGDPVFASNTPSSWSIITYDTADPYFTIDNGGQITVLSPLGPLFKRRASFDVTLTLRAFNCQGSSADVDVVITIVEASGSVPVILPGQIREISNAITPGTSVGDPIIASFDPTFWHILTEDPDEGAFEINNSGQIATLIFLDYLDFTRDDTQVVVLTIQAGNEFGLSAPVDVLINITLTVTFRCADIPDDLYPQTRFISRLANVGDNIGDPLDSHGIDSFWIEAAWVNGMSVPSSFFRIGADDGQLTVGRPYEDFPATFPANAVTLVSVMVVGHNVPPQGCPEFIFADVNVYILPADSSVPRVLPGQVRYLATSAGAGASVGSPILAAGAVSDPPSPITGWSIAGGNDDNVFEINNGGQILTVLSPTLLTFVDGVATVPLEVVVFNDQGASAPVVVTIIVTEDGEAPTTGGSITGQITFASNADPIVITSVAHGLISGNQVSIANVFGNTDANGIFFITVVDANMFSLDGSSGNGDWQPSPLATWTLLNGAGEPAEDFSQFITDAALLNCVKSSLGLGAAEALPESSVTSMTHLDCSCRDDVAITDISGLRFFVNLEFLSLVNNLIGNIQPLTGLTALTDLRLSGNLIADIETDNPLASLQNLTHLDLSENQIRGTNAFSTLAQLHFVSLADNNICDITSLVQLALDGGLGDDDTVILDGNHLHSTAGLNQISQIETTGTFVSHFDNDSICPPFFALALSVWPNPDIRVFLEFMDGRSVAPCN